jgi:hypothetical protein
MIKETAKSIMFGTLTSIIVFAVLVTVFTVISL